MKTFRNTNVQILRQNRSSDHIVHSGFPPPTYSRSKSATNNLQASIADDLNPVHVQCVAHPDEALFLFLVNGVEEIFRSAHVSAHAILLHDAQELKSLLPIHGRRSRYACHEQWEDDVFSLQVAVADDLAGQLDDLPNTLRDFGEISGARLELLSCPHTRMGVDDACAI